MNWLFGPSAASPGANQAGLLASPLGLAQSGGSTAAGGTGALALVASLTSEMARTVGGGGSAQGSDETLKALLTLLLLVMLLQLNSNDQSQVASPPGSQTFEQTTLQRSGGGFEFQQSTAIVLYAEQPTNPQAAAANGSTGGLDVVA